MSRRGRTNIVSILLTVIVVGGIYGAWLFVPPYLVRVKMQELTKSVVLDWAGLNEAKARRRVPEEFRRQEIPSYIEESMCQFKTEGKNKIFTCSWQIDIYYVPTDYYKTLEFTTWAMHDGISVITE